MPEPDPLARPFDQPGNVCDDELPPVGGLDGAEHGGEGRERVVGDLRPRVRDPREERRLAGVRQADEGGVGEQLQSQLDRALLPGHADLGEARRLPRRPREALVPAPTGPALRDDDACTGMREVRDEALLLVEDLRADGHREHRLLPVGPVREPAAAGAALAGAEPLVRADAGEVAAARVGDEDDVAAPAAVTAVGAAFRDVLLAPEVDRAVAAAAGDHRQPRSIVEHARTLARIRRRTPTRERGSVVDAGGGND